MNPGATLVILSWDEHEALTRLLPTVPMHLFARIIAVDAGSTDGTLELYRDWNVEAHVQPRPGRGSAFIFAQQLVETERVVFLSADGNEDPGDLATILAYLDDGYDMVIGGRFLLAGSASDNSDDPFRLRRAGSISISFLARLLWRTGIRDACNGYRGFATESMRRLHLDAPHNEIELQSTIRATKLGMRIKEFATRELERLGGEHKPTAKALTLGSRALALIARELVIARSFARDAR